MREVQLFRKLFLSQKIPMALFAVKPSSLADEMLECNSAFAGFAESFCPGSCGGCVSNDVYLRFRDIAVKMPVEGSSCGIQYCASGKSFLFDIHRLSEDVFAVVIQDSFSTQCSDEYSYVLNAIPCGYFRVSPDGRLIDGNKSLAAIFGFENLDGLKSFIARNGVSLIIDPSTIKMILKNIKTSNFSHLYSVSLRKNPDGVVKADIETRAVKDALGNILYYEGVLQDISEKFRLQEMLIRSEKMVTVAGLASGIAHEINNPLSIILQTADNARRRLLEASEKNVEFAAKYGIDFDNLRGFLQERKIDRYFESITEAGERASKIVTNMLRFSRRSDTRHVDGELSVMVENALNLADNDYSLQKNFNFKNILITRSFSDAVYVRCIESEIEQAFYNVIKNSVQALSSVSSAGFKPEVTIRTGRENRKAFVVFSDNGPGMDEATKSHVFDPFYSTRDGEGIGGLGLFIAYFIVVNNHGGTIEVSSSVGKGSEVKIVLPEISGGA